MTILGRSTCVTLPKSRLQSRLQPWIEQQVDELVFGVHSNLSFKSVVLVLCVWVEQNAESHCCSRARPAKWHNFACLGQFSDPLVRHSCTAQGLETVSRIVQGQGQAAQSGGLSGPGALPGLLVYYSCRPRLQICKGQGAMNSSQAWPETREEIHSNLSFFKKMIFLEIKRGYLTLRSRKICMIYLQFTWHIT